MPNRDGKGPEGKGSKTGRQMGKCKDAKPNENAPRIGLGRKPQRAFRRGLGKGLRKNFKKIEE